MRGGTRLFQVHWQNHHDVRQTEFVGQAECGDAEQVVEWATELIVRRQAECPEGWGPLVCTEDSDYFVRTNSISVAEAMPAWRASFDPTPTDEETK